MQPESFAPASPEAAIRMGIALYGHQAALIAAISSGVYRFQDSHSPKSDSERHVIKARLGDYFTCLAANDD